MAVDTGNRVGSGHLLLALDPPFRPEGRWHISVVHPLKGFFLPEAFGVGPPKLCGGIQIQDR